MAEDSSRAAEPQQRHHTTASPEGAQQTGEQLVPSALPGYSLGLLGDPRIGGRGNGPVRAALVQRMQQTSGNRATGRILQRLAASRLPVPVQREDGDEEEQQAKVIPPAPNRPLPALPDAKNGRIIPPAPNRPLPPLPNQKVGELELSVDVETKNRAKLGLFDLLGGNVGHTWIKIFWDAKKAGGPVPEGISDPTRAQLNAKASTSMGFWPLVFRASDWTEESKQARADKLQGIPDPTPQQGASDNKDHSGFSIKRDKYVPGRVEQPDKSHTPKAIHKYDLTMEGLEGLAAYTDSKRNAAYNLYDFNCTTFALGATAAAKHSPPSGEDMNGRTYPNALYAQIYDLLKSNDKSGYDAKKGYLASLAADEQHVKPAKKG